MSRSNLSGKSESTSSQDHTIKEAVSVEVLKNSSLKVEESENGETSQPMLPDTLSGSSINHHPAVTEKKDVLPPSAEHLIEPTVSDLEREILLRGDSAEKRTKILQLPSTSLRNTPSHCEREAVGDDRAQNRVHVLCECEQPTVAGAAVPIVTSFTAPNSNGMYSDCLGINLSIS